MGSAFGPQRGAPQCVCQKGTGTWFPSTGLCRGPGASSLHTDGTRSSVSCVLRSPLCGPIASLSGARSQQTLGLCFRSHQSHDAESVSYSCNRSWKINPVWEAGSLRGVGQFRNRWGLALQTQCCGDLRIIRHRSGSQREALMSRSKFKFSLRKGQAGRLQRRSLCREGLCSVPASHGGHS